MSLAEVAAESRAWIERFVLGHKLCPFALHLAGDARLRVVASAARRESELLDDLTEELRRLAATPMEVLETTVLVHPRCLVSFEAQLDFVDAGTELLSLLGLAGEIQLVAFHPDFRFADARAEDPGNYVNRSPFGMLHLLREASVEAVMGDPSSLAKAERLSERNAERLEAMGAEPLEAALDEHRRAAEAEADDDMRLAEAGRSGGS